MFSQRNRGLPALTAQEDPDSLTQLAALEGRSNSNLSRALQAMSRCGFVELEEGRRGTQVPRVTYSQVRIDLSPTAPSQALA